MGLNTLYGMFTQTIDVGFFVPYENDFNFMCGKDCIFGGMRRIKNLPTIYEAHLDPKSPPEVTSGIGNLIVKRDVGDKLVKHFYGVSLCDIQLVTHRGKPMEKLAREYVEIIPDIKLPPNGMFFPKGKVTKCEK